MKNRMTSLLVTLALSAGLLCGCGGQGGEPAPAPTPEPPTTIVEEVLALPEEETLPEEPGTTRQEPPPAQPGPVEPEASVETPAEEPEPVPAQPAPAPAPEPEPDPENKCTFSISCAVLLARMEDLPPEKATLVPEDGWILAPVEVEFEPEESVFDLLQRVCRAEKLHLEFVDTPGTGSVYIEGIHNLYEFDFGSLSGWKYSVNGSFPNVGCGSYPVEAGDEICWAYTCDLGADLTK